MLTLLAIAAIATASPATTLRATADASPLAFLPRNDPGTAALLSVAVNGAGQFYNGDDAKGWWLLASWALYPVGWLADSYFQTGYYRTGALALTLGAKAYSAWDAYATAAERRSNQ
ncbi:MAG: hypothetical protein FJZ01_16690 [Candidatus Sericytochromatia bacterium]|nr:hypothetical protein [Candidatus Tanganyikabacteria bacterium]